MSAKFHVPQRRANVSSLMKHGEAPVIKYLHSQKERKSVVKRGTIKTAAEGNEDQILNEY